MRNKGYELVNFCEFDKFAETAYCAVHDADKSKNLGDITKVDETKLAPFNMICGGSPCQDFSVSGNSIVVDVLYYIFKNLYEVMPYLFEDLKVGSYFSGIGAFEKALDRVYLGENL